MRRRSWRFWTAMILGGFAVMLAAAAWVWREDILRTALDPRIPYQTYDPPPAPDYAERSAWALLPARPASPTAADPPADVFFIHPTTYDGGSEWNAPIGDRKADRILERDMLPNYAGPYQRLARVFAPRYRQASLYTQLTLRDDARAAREFAYRDIQAAFRLYRGRYDRGRPFLVVGVGQGGSLAARLLSEEIAPDASLRGRLVVAHLIETVTPEIAGLPSCGAPAQAGCVLAFVSVPEGDEGRGRRVLERALVWRGGRLVGLEGRPAVCVNPLLGAPGSATAERARGSASATGLPWGARPAFLRHQVGARCVGGVLQVTRPESPALRRRGGWAERMRAPAFNLFYADLEADAATRLRALRNGEPVPPPGR